MTIVGLLYCGCDPLSIRIVEGSLPPPPGVFFLFVFVYEDKKCRSISDFNLMTLIPSPITDYDGNVYYRSIFTSVMCSCFEIDHWSVPNKTFLKTSGMINSKQ